MPQQEAYKKGYQQILWLYGEQHQLTEVGTMNLFGVFEHNDGSQSRAISPRQRSLAQVC